MSAIAAVLHAAHGSRAGECLLDAMAHRGPKVRYEEHEGAIIGARAADDESLVSARGICVAIDGNIHNRSELAEAGIDERDTSAAVVLKCYERWGAEAVAQLTGDFAFVLHDSNRDLLLCARDAIGMRALYYHRDKDMLWIASEAQALVANGIAVKRPDLLAVSLFVAGTYDEDGYTLYEQIDALPPGHLLEATAGAIRVRPYWRPNPWRKLQVDEAEAAEMLAEVFREAVRCRLPRSGKLGVMLSGGLDSSSVACQASALANNRPTALHISLSGRDSDETPLSGAVAKKWGLETIDVAADGADMFEARRPRMRHPDMLYHATAADFDVLFAKAREAGVSTVMTGLGGDEVLDETGGECADALRAGDIREVAAIAGVDREPLSLSSYGRVWSSGVKRLIPVRARLAARRLRRRSGPLFLSRAAASRVMEHDDATRVRRMEDRYPDETSRDLCFKLSHYGVRVGATQANLRGLSMGMDIAHPFLDRRVFELSLSLPRAHRLRRGYLKNKPLLRRAVASLLPVEVLGRRDAAEFSCYLRDVYVRYHRDEIDALLRDSRLEQLGVLDGAALRAAMHAGLPDASSIKHFGLILSMELWLRRGWS